MVALRRPGDRQVYLVQPKFPPSYWGLDHFLPLTPFKAIYPPLGLVTLAALAPPEFTVAVCDENAGEKINYDTDAEIVGITGYIIQMARAFEIADRFRALGKTVIMGGPVANLLPQLCRQHCDVLFEGEAEYTWPRFLNEYAAGKHGDHYHELEKIHLPDSPAPRLDVLKRKYAHGIIQCTRGCPFTCEFCDIIVMYGRKMRFKPVEQIIEEIEAWKELGAAQILFADDNFIGHRAYAKDLLRAVAAWNRKQRQAMTFYTQASIDMVRDDELMALMRDANFASVFIGIESPRKASLAETHKTQNEKLDLVAAIHKVQSYNMFILAGMIVGFDNDDPSIFEEQFKFLQEANIPLVMLSVLLAVPKTPLYERLEKAGRLANADDPTHYVGTAGGTNFRPLNMTQEELRTGQEDLYHRLYDPDAFASRLLGNLHKFNNVTYRPEGVALDKVATFFRLAAHYWRKGWKARKFFWGAIWKTIRHSPRSTRQVVMMMGMYKHFCEVHASASEWDPWAKQPKAPPKPVAAPEPVALMRQAAG